MSRFPEVIHKEVITDFEAFYKLEQEWNTLLANISHYTPTMTFYWQKAWLEVNKDKILKIHIFVFRDQNHKLIGLVPLIHLKAPFLLRNLNLYTFSGARDQIKISLICQREHQISVLLEVLSHFYEKHHDWDILALRRISSNRADEIFLERILRKHHRPFSVESHLRIPYILLEGDYASYFQSRKKHFRHEIKRKIKKLSQLGELQYEMNEAPVPGEQFAQFVELENKGWKGKNASSLKHRQNLLLLFQKLSKTNQPTLSLIQFNLRLNQELISSSLCFKTRDGLHVFKIAYDEAFKKYSPGLLLRLFEIEQAFGLGLKIYDFSGKEQRWMHDFTRRTHHVMDYIIYRKTFASLIRYLGFTRFRPLIKHSHLTEKFLKSLIEE